MGSIIWRITVFFTQGQGLF